MLIVVSDWVKESSFLELSDRLALMLGFVISIKFSRPFYVVFYLLYLGLEISFLRNLDVAPVSI